MGTARAMRQLGNQLLKNLRVPADDDGLIDAISDAVNAVRGREVQLLPFVFPPSLPSGLWIDRTDRDIIAFDVKMRLEHKLVIIFHEIWHMFRGHCGSQTAHGPAASRALDDEFEGKLRDVVEAIVRITGTDVPSVGRMDASLHVATRTSAGVAREEREAEQFGILFATELQAALAEARSTADPANIAGRIGASMAHLRIRGS
ncbi:hypothetical protein [Streptomyces flaveolus]|uniref:hypothetical protein n=1 Tax=Streptomyces flaveolus TaxID=67297 RepID=UPI0037007497